MKDTTGEDLFQEIEKCFLKYHIDWKKLVNVTTDGAPNMTGKNIGVIKRIEDKIFEIDPDHKIRPIHCIIHQHVLCKNVLKIDHVTKIVVKLVNFLRAKGLNHRQFIDFLEELNTTYSDVIYYNKIRWLSLGKVLKRVWELQEEIRIFLVLKENEEFPELTDPDWLGDFAFSLDILTYLNEFNTSLQGKKIFAYDLMWKLKAFKMKLLLFSTNLAESKFDHFPSLKTISAIILKEKAQMYTENILALRLDFENRFECFNRIDKILSIVRNPFTANIEEASPDIQLELIALQCDQLLHDKYREEEDNLCNFYKQLDSKKYVNLKNLAKKYLIIFSSTYICEQTFSLMNHNKSPTRSR
ncbi:general transcription factor II-I repeat domain-containing protein 2-like [Cylas formicarius]|uniref:general transcription factor II-I repeat domain-containing protein 2-like n=1 Tax=Cylas formicarius TaxID=197179 RepID=UPI00295888B0|nr:general transcription factor II-I repeat domain-containing protein 2-like [Cylas formicarius]XP_060528337.1 general transcription factor II-I repeat domain-containing protein 2-like [Cylas formicarius]XP_060528338.1 general transcription factor II-I repeat domain-containing protein 2-like [Cylas formicarius]